MKNKNHAITLASTGSTVLDFFSRAAACRSLLGSQAGIVTITQLFDAAYAENPELAVRTLFYTRDVRGGQGERGVFRTILAHLAATKPEIVSGNLNAIVEMGRWDDIVSLLLTNCEQEAARFLYAQLLADIENSQQGKPISILAKWLPSANTSSANTRLLAKRFMRLVGIKQEREYRKTLSALRRKIDIVERKLCAREFGEINYETIPARSGIKYRNAFLEKDGERYRAHIGAVLAGVKKVKAQTLFPYDIISPLFRSGTMGKRGDKYYATVSPISPEEEEVMEAYWKSLPNYFENGQSALVVVDTSGSMRGLPIKVAVSLGLYCATKSKGEFAGTFITFSENPQLQALSGSTIAQQASNMSQAEWGGSTNIQAVFANLLHAARRHAVPASGMASKIFIISDMQFDQADPTNKATNFEAIRAQYAEFGYQMPELVFWNVNGAADSPVAKDERGVMLVSGCSPSILKTALTGKITSPYEKMLDVLSATRYDGLYVGARI